MHFVHQIMCLSDWVKFYIDSLISIHDTDDTDNIDNTDGDYVNDRSVNIIQTSNTMDIF